MHSFLPAKLSRPRLFDTTPRERLFGILDRLRRHPAIWVEGPAGSGKTALIASYLEARRLSAFWFQVDGDDADPASFFLYLRQLPGVDAAHLPTYADEHSGDIPRFARRFFRALYQGIGPGAALVFDDVHEAIDSPGLRDALREAIAQAPEGIVVVLASRGEPPATFARFVAQQALALVRWPDLQLTAEEVAAIAGLEPGQDGAQIAALGKAAGGWAAGLILLLARPAGAHRNPAPTLSMERVYEFLAAEILDAAPAATRELLLATWPLTRLTPALAETLTGKPGAARILAEMYQQNYFLERLPSPEVAYRYHSLFRDFLEAKARAQFGAAACAALEARAAALLESVGALTEAFARYRAAGEVAACSRLVVAHGPDLAASGRLRTLGEWLDALPEFPPDDQPWLDYWRGACDLATAPLAARRAFARAADAFAVRGNLDDSIRAVSGVIDTIYAEWSDFSLLDPWIDRLVGLIERKGIFAEPGDELKAVSAALVALLYRQPRHAALDALADRTRRLLTAEVAAIERVAAGTYLLNTYNWMGKTAAAREVIALVGPAVVQPHVSAMRKAWWEVRLAYHHYIAGETPATLAALENARTLAQDNGFVVIENIVEHYSAFHYLSEGAWAAAEQAIAAYESRLDPARHLDYAIASYQRAWLALAAGNLDQAQELAQRAVTLALQAGVPNVQGYFTLLVALVSARRGKADAAGLVDQAMALTDCERFPLFAFTAGLVAADFAQGRNESGTAADPLAAALAIGARNDYGNSLLWLADSVSRLCAAALERSLESDYVVRLIARRRLVPPGPQNLAWPWPLRVHTLGSLRVELAGEPLRFTRKAQKKPLAVLMALVALGGRDVSAAHLAELLWPDADGDAARAALNTALYRLRHLLEVDDAIVLVDGKLSLDPQRVWVDRRAFEALDGESRHGSGAVVAGRKAFELYQGHFLDREEEAPWMIAPRNALKARFAKLIENLGQALEAEGRDDEAVSAYERGIALDMLAEPFYRRLMACHARRGQTAMALETYRRCRQSLSVVLGVAPSAATEALRKSLGQ